VKSFIYNPSERCPGHCVSCSVAAWHKTMHATLVWEQRCSARRIHSAGSLFEEDKRKAVPRLIVGLLALSTLTVAVNIWGSWLLYRLPGVCLDTPQEWRPNSGFTALVWTTWVVVAFFFICVIAPLQIFPAAVRSDPRSWRLRCALLACCCCKWRYAHKQPAGSIPYQRTCSGMPCTLRLAGCSQAAATCLHAAPACLRMHAIHMHMPVRTSNTVMQQTWKRTWAMVPRAQAALGGIRGW
jgi:hypothetical protein